MTVSFFTNLLVDLGELLQVVLKEGNLLLLGHMAKSLLTVQLCTLKKQSTGLGLTWYLYENKRKSPQHETSCETVTYLLHTSGEILHEQFAQVVKSLQLFGLRK